MSDYELCEDCKHACFHSEDPGFSPRECGLSSHKITYLEGCKKDLEPYYNEEEECVDCEGYESKPCEW